MIERKKKKRPYSEMFNYFPKFMYFFTFCYFHYKSSNIGWWGFCLLMRNIRNALETRRHYCTFVPPSFLLMILVQNFMLIKNHIVTWVWKSTETKLFTSKVLQNLEVTMKKRHGFNTTILSPSWKIDKLKNNITKITQQ